MGRRNKEYKRDLKQQIYTRLTGMLHKGVGTSKHAAKILKADRDAIYSYNTFRGYWKNCKHFARYIAEHHPNCTTLKSARKYVKEYLQYIVDNGGNRGQPLSPYTITTKRQALNKLFGISPDDKDYFFAPKRRRVDIKRSRVPVDADKHFSERNNREFVNFCRATGCRRNILKKLRGADLADRKSMIAELMSLKSKNNLAPSEIKHMKELKKALETFPSQDYFLHHRTDKGGKSRYAPIIGDHKEDVIRRMKSKPATEKVWLNVPAHADIHSYRADYANELYHKIARPIESIPYDRFNSGTKQKYQSDVYCCRKDKAGKRYDRAAMRKTSIALGHGRVSVIAGHYLI